jgi:pyrroloquinoline quinone biosynthesis protein B
MRVRVLGAAAGGGFPQWNCACSNCAGLRAGSLDARPRSQASAAVSGDGRDWFLLNASPDIRQQIDGFAALHPRAPRDTPIAGIVLTNGDIDACLGLLILRESQPLHVYATATVIAGLIERNVLFRTLARTADQVTWHRLGLGRAEPLVGVGGASGLTLEAVPVAGKVPLHLETLAAPSAEDNIGLVIRDGGGKTLAYFPSLAGPSPEADRQARAADVLMVDGTFFEEDELRRLGLGTRGARDMAHWHLGGDDGSLPWLRSLPCRRKILVHINNTNPILREDAPERAQLAAAGVEVGWDGLEVQL